MVALLPYLEQDAVYKQFDLTKGYAENGAASHKSVKLFLCPARTPAESEAIVTHYVAMSGIGHDAATQPAGAIGNGFMGYERSTSMESLADGASYTIALMETRTGLGPWARGGPTTLRGFDPADLPLFVDGRPFGGHDKFCHAAMADGSVRTISSTIAPGRLAAAITIAGGEPFDFLE